MLPEPSLDNGYQLFKSIVLSLDSAQHCTCALGEWENEEKRMPALLRGKLERVHCKKTRSQMGGFRALIPRYFVIVSEREKGVYYFVEDNTQVSENTPLRIINLQCVRTL